MTREEARNYCKSFISRYLQDKGIDTRSNFICLNPEHSESRPSMGLKNNNCHCFACGANYDIFDLIALDYGYSFQSREAMEATYKYCGVSIEGNTYTYTHTQHSIHNNTYTTPTKEGGAMGADIDITPEVEAAHKALYTESGSRYLEYLHRRRIPDNIIKAYKIGFDPEGFNHLLTRYPEHRTLISKNGIDHAKDLYKSVIPTFDEAGRAIYFTSEIGDRSRITAQNGKYLKIKGLQQPLFNARYLIKDTPEIIYICEGIYNALSIEAAGGRALALMGTGSNTIVELCKKYQPQTKFIVAADGDPAGENAADTIQKKLEEIGYICIIQPPPEIPGKEKPDYNDFLVHDPAGFTSFIGRTNQEAFDKAAAEISRKLEAARAELEKECSANYVKGFLQRAAENAHRETIKTGFDNLDNALCGGLYEGLYVVGAVSGAGKTAFTMQIADNIAATGHDVLIFALEMSRDELIARSLSRLTLLLDLQQNQSTQSASDHLSIRMGKCSTQQKRLVMEAVKEYSGIGQHIYINEGVGDIDVSFIKKKVENHIAIQGRPPVLIVDYLQILAPDQESEVKRATDKQIIDKAVLELKRLSRDFHIPIISISSFNRDNYNEPINLASFKESGSIEYTATAVIGLQFPFMEYQKKGNSWETDGDRRKRLNKDRDELKEKKRKGEPLTIQCKMCKYRDGAEHDTYFKFFPRFMCYKPTTPPEPDPEPEKEQTGDEGAEALPPSGMKKL